LQGPHPADLIYEKSENPPFGSIWILGKSMDFHRFQNVKYGRFTGSPSFFLGQRFSPWHVAHQIHQISVSAR